MQNPSLSLDASTMGPPKIDETDPGWQDFIGATLAGRPLTGRTIVDAAATPSWYPYHYRIAAVGEEDLANGLYSGESPHSGAQAEFALPPDPPLLASFVLGGGHQTALVTLLTDLPVTPSPLGPALAEVVQFVPDPANPGHLQAVDIVSSTPDQIEVGVIVPPPLPPPQPPLPPQPPTPVGRMARSQPDAAGRWTLYALFPYTQAQKGTFAVRLTDPIGRQSSRSF